MSRNLLIIAIALALGGNAPAVSAGGKESRLAQQLAATVHYGAIVHLKVDVPQATQPPVPKGTKGGKPGTDTAPAAAKPGTAAQQQVLALYAENEAPRRIGGAILVHDVGGHPDWPGVIATLRRRLPPGGWSTLSVQMPLPDRSRPAKAMLADAEARIGAAVANLQGRGIKHIALIGHGAGAVMAAAYLAQTPDSPAEALVAISMGTYLPLGKDVTAAKLLERIRVPFFDIYGGNDLDVVLHSAHARAVLAHKGRPAEAAEAAELSPSRQVCIRAAGHDFAGLESTLANWVRGWLTQRAKAPAPRPAPAATSEQASAVPPTAQKQ